MAFFIALAIASILFVVIVLVGFSTKESVISLQEFSVLLVLFFGAILLLVYKFEPKSLIRWDLLEHYKEIDRIKAYGWKYAINNSQYSRLYITIGYFYLFSLMPDYSLLPVFPMAIEFAICLYILNKQMRLVYGDIVPLNNVVFVVYAWFSVFGLQLAVSGIRCVFAVSLAFLALYLEYIENKKNVFIYFLYIIPIFIHDFAIVVIAIRILMIIKKKNVIFSVILVSMIVGPNILLPLIKKINISYLRSTVSILERYLENTSILKWFIKATMDSKTIYLCFVMVVIYLFFSVKNKRINKRIDGRLRNVAETVSLCALAACFNYVFLERIMYVVAYALLIYLPSFYKYEVSSEWFDYLKKPFIFVVMLWSFFFHDIYLFLVNWTGVFFLAR